MKRLMGIVAMAFMFSVLLCNQGFSATLGGQLVYRGAPIEDVVLTFFDSVNAELITTTTSDVDGFFGTELKPGQYKIHLYRKTKDGYCLAEFYNSSVAGENSFDLGEPVTVIDGKKDLGRVLVFIDDKPFGCALLCVDREGYLWGVVSDSSGVGIPDIRLQFKDPTTAFPLLSDLFTLPDGSFTLYIRSTCESLDVKIRFSDPTGIYTAEYWGTTDSDEFSAGEHVDFNGARVEIVDSLAKLPPAEQIAGIIDDILAVLPPGDAQPVVNSLNQAQGLFLDGNPNNDQGACGVLTGTTNKIMGLVASGGLLQHEADPLLASIDATKTDLGCKK